MTNKASERPKTDRPSLLSLFLTFAKIGVMTFGGGYAMLPILQREVVESRGWATDEELANYFAIGQCTPGVIAVNTATFIGHKKRGIPGAITGTLGLVFPSLVIITTLAGVIARFSDNPYVQKAFMGIRVCVCALILKAIIKLLKSAVKDRLTLAIYIAVAVLSLCLDLSPVVFVLVMIALGIFLVFIKKPTGGDGKEASSGSDGGPDGSSGKEVVS